MQIVFKNPVCVLMKELHHSTASYYHKMSLILTYNVFPVPYI